MNDVLSSSRVIRAITADHHVRFAVLDAAPLWDGVRRGHPHLDAEACACLVEILSGALLLQSRNFFSERLQLMLRGAGKVKTLVADSWPEGDIRGVVDLATEATDLPWILGPGVFNVMRSNRKGRPYIGTLELVKGPIQAQLEAYLLQSEQVQASATLWCDPGTGEAGGLLVEPLPRCPHDRLDRLVHAIEGLEVVPIRERDLDFLCRWINQGEGAEVLFATEVQYHCRCTRESLVEILQGFAQAKLDELFHDESPVEVRCDYCGKIYLLDREECVNREKGVHGQA
jgi:molecular chaperone Hsp33